MHVFVAMIVTRFDDLVAHLPDVIAGHLDRISQITNHVPVNPFLVQDKIRWLAFTRVTGDLLIELGKEWNSQRAYLIWLVASTIQIESQGWRSQ